MSTANKILVANIGSTSFKFRLLEMPSETVLAQGLIERIGSSDSSYKFVLPGEGEVKASTPFPDYTSAMEFVEKYLVGKVVESFDELAAFGFKPVMAKNVSGTQIFDEHVLGAMEELADLLPAHNPPYINAVRAFRAAYPTIPCIGTFETAFYDHLPAENQRFPIPLEWEEKYDVRRTGFHGASHRFVTERAADLLGQPGARVISCHLGGSSSIAAVRDGHAINSSWGMTPQSGLPQSNRVGDFDVFALLYLLKQKGMSLETVEKALGSQSGLKGMSGLESGDIRDLHEAAEAGNHRASEALAVYVGSIRKYIGQFLVEMNGADAIVMTAGIGENAAHLRKRIFDGMDFAGIQLDEEVNASLRATEGKITTNDSTIQVWVIPTNEELIIARNAWEKLNPLTTKQLSGEAAAPAAAG